MAYAHRDPKTKKLTGRYVADAEFKVNQWETKRHHKTYASKDEAERVEQFYRLTGQLPPEYGALARNTFAEVAERFKGRNKEWLDAHYTNGQRLDECIAFLGKFDVAQVRASVLEDFVDTLRKRAGRGNPHASNRTIRHYLAATFKVLKYANALDLLPQGLPERPSVANTGRTRNALTAAQERTVVATMETLGHRDSAFYVKLLAATGMRCGELDGLRAEQIELPEQRENTGWMLTEEQTKTNKRRWVPCVPELARELKALLANHALPKRSRVYGIFKRALELHGEDKHLTLHCLRHTTVTRLLETGANFMDVAEIVGHKTGKTTSIYYHPNKAHLFSVAEKVQHVHGETPPSAEVVPLNLQRKTA